MELLEMCGLHFLESQTVVRLVKRFSNEISSKVWRGKHLSDVLVIQNGLKQGDASLPLLFTFAVVVR